MAHRFILLQTSLLMMVVCVLSGCVAPTTPDDAPGIVLYHPTVVGTKWVYESNGQENTEVIMEAVETAGITTVVVGEPRPTPIGDDSPVSFLPIHAMNVSDAGLSIETFNVSHLTEPLWMLKLPHHEGNSWEPVLASENWGRVVGTAMASGPESVTVPAGTYQAIRVVIELPYIDGREGLAKKTIWFAPNVGRVKEEYAGQVSVLKSFTPGHPAIAE